MAKDDNDIILHYRNAISLDLDDMTALTPNSAMANVLRDFSKEVMGLTPGFAFSLQQAKKLKGMTEKELAQYRRQSVSDGELMNFVSNAHALLRDEKSWDGGNKMSSGDKLHRLLHWKETRKEDALRDAEKRLSEVYDQMLDCERIKAECIEAAKGQAPGSQAYRSNERKFKTATEKLALLKRQEASLTATLDTAERIRLVDEYNESVQAIHGVTKMLTSDVTKYEKTLASAEAVDEMIKDATDEMADYGSTLFTEEPAETRADSEFSALVASAERRQDMQDGAAAMDGEKTTEPVSEFAKSVSDAEKQ